MMKESYLCDLCQIP